MSTNDTFLGLLATTFLPEYQTVRPDANYNWNVGYNQALDDVRNLNAGTSSYKQTEALMFACKYLSIITSSDGSGHADIALAVLRMVGVRDGEREKLVDSWKAGRAWTLSKDE